VEKGKHTMELSRKDKIEILFEIYKNQLEMAKFYDQKAVIVLSVNAGIMAATLWEH